VLREAITLVEQSGLAEVRRGKVGGLVVCGPNAEMVADALRNYLEHVTTDWEDMFATRLAREELVLVIAAKRLSEEDIERVESLICRFDQTEAPADFVRLQLAYLQECLRIAANPCLSVFTLAMASLSVGRMAMHRPFERALLKRAKQICSCRRDELRAVLAMDEGGALEACHRHYAIFREINQEAHSDLGQAEDPVDGGEEHSVLLTVKLGRPTMKRAEAVANQITARIVHGGLKPGDRLGSEVDLLAEYGVGRGVMREAIRILERQAIVKPLRGKRGGLHVVEPQPDMVVKTVAAYIRSLNVSHHDLVQVGDTLDLLGAGMAAQRVRSQPVTAEQLRERFAVLQTAAPLRDLSLAYYTLAGDLSGNRPLAALLSILPLMLADDETRHGDGSTLGSVDPDRLNSLFEAIATGNVAQARRRMLILRRRGARMRISSPPRTRLQEQAAV